MNGERYDFRQQGFADPGTPSGDGKGDALRVGSTALGGVIGALVGISGGPLGVLAGASAGMSMGSRVGAVGADLADGERDRLSADSIALAQAGMNLYDRSGGAQGPK